MKAPALAIVAGFAAGIALSGRVAILPAAWAALAVASLLAALGFLRRDALRVAWIAGLAAWLFLGALAATLERAARPHDNAAVLIASGRIDISEPLRWRGHLRSDAVRLAGGLRYEVDLDEVESGGRPIRVSGGLRASLFEDPPASAGPPPALRAGDRAELLLHTHAPRSFLNPGAFDVRGHFERQGIHLVGTLRSAMLVQKLAERTPTWPDRLARLRGTLLDRLDKLYSEAPERAAVLRAMLLGDRSFVDHELALEFQKTAIYHVLVIAGLHVAALAWFVFWLGRRLRLKLEWTALLTLAVLGAYLAVVEDRPPILRAGVMAAAVLGARLLYRRAELANTVSIAALGILSFRPSALADSSFQLSFTAAGTIAALAAPWVERTSEPYRRALRHLTDVTRDPSHSARAAQFRLDVRGVARRLETRLPARLARFATSLVTLPCAAALRLWEVFLVSAVIQLGMLPLLAYYFHRVTLAGPVANVPAVLLTGLIVPLGFVTLAASFVWYSLAAHLARMPGLLVTALVESGRWFARGPHLSYRIPGPPLWLLAAFILALVSLSIAARPVARTTAATYPLVYGRKRRWELSIAGALAALAVCVATYPFPPRLERGRLEATVLDVGQGDAIFLAFPDGRTMLIDGGGTPPYGSRRSGGISAALDPGEEAVSPYLWWRGLKRLDVVALTHAHQDHLGGLRAVLENFRVGQLWVGRDIETPAFRGLLEEAAARGARIVHHRRGDTFSWGDVTGIVLWPEDVTPAEKASNNDSLVLRLDYGRAAWLLPGDIEQKVEKELVSREDPLAADFLKIAHHGSRTSTTTEFFSAVAPRIGAVSAGENNPFGHPSPAVIAAISGRGMRLLRTDRDGAITVTSDGRALRVETFAAQLPP